MDNGGEISAWSTLWKSSNSRKKYEYVSMLFRYSQELSKFYSFCTELLERRKREKSYDELSEAVVIIKCITNVFSGVIFMLSDL